MCGVAVGLTRPASASWAIMAREGCLATVWCLMVPSSRKVMLIWWLRRVPAFLGGASAPGGAGCVLKSQRGMVCW